MSHVLQQNIYKRMALTHKNDSLKWKSFLNADMSSALGHWKKRFLLPKSRASHQAENLGPCSLQNYKYKGQLAQSRNTRYSSACLTLAYLIISSLSIRRNLTLSAHTSSCIDWGQGLFRSFLPSSVSKGPRDTSEIYAWWRCSDVCTHLDHCTVAWGPWYSCLHGPYHSKNNCTHIMRRRIHNRYTKIHTFLGSHTQRATCQSPTCP